MAQAQSIPQPTTLGVTDAEKIRYSRRALVNRSAAGCLGVLTLVSVSFLFMLLLFIFVNGISGLTPEFFTQTTKAELDGTISGGVLQSILGTLIILIAAAVIAVPIGIATAIYLAEYGRGRLARTVDFVIDLLAGLPSIVVGLFILAFLIGRFAVVPIFPGYSGFAGALALAVIMIPIVARSVEQILKLVPDTLREAGLALGMPKWRVVLRIVLPTVSGGLATGIMLALARAAGETAPLLLTILGTDFLSTNLSAPMDALPVRIYQFASSGDPSRVPKAWTGTLVLVIVIAFLSILVRAITSKSRVEN
jgi:phosphate transport system permease protein